jgi:hypothetical protein
MLGSCALGLRLCATYAEITGLHIVSRRHLGEVHLMTARAFDYISQHYQTYTDRYLEYTELPLTLRLIYAALVAALFLLRFGALLIDLWGGYVEIHG